MANQDNGGSSVLNTAQNTAQAINDAKDTVKAVAKAAKQSKGNIYAFAAAMLKEMLKDPKLFLKILKTALILVLAPLLVIILVIVCFGAAILAFIQQLLTDIVNYVCENNGSWGNIDWDLTGGMLVAGGTFIGELITGPDKPKDDATGKTYDLDEGYDVDAEMNIMRKAEAPGTVLTKRIAMIRRSCAARRMQYLILFEPLCKCQAILASLYHCAVTFYHNPTFMIIGDVALSDNMTEITDLDAAAILCAYSVSKDVSFDDIAVLDLRYWIGHYSGLGTIFGLNERVKPRNAGSPETIDVTSVKATSEDGAYSEVVSLNTSWIRVPKWFGTFVPQYVLEQIQQDKLMDVKIQNGVATEAEIASGQGYLFSSTGAAPSYPSGRGLIDDLVVLEYNPTLVFTHENVGIGKYYDDLRKSGKISGIESFLTYLEEIGAYGLDGIIEFSEKIWADIRDEAAELGNDILDFFGLGRPFDEESAPSWEETLDALGEMTVIDVFLFIPLKINHYEEIVTNVIGLWEGPLENHDASGKNRDFAAQHSEDANKLLYYQWTDNRGVTYTRQRGYQYENFMDSLEGLSAEYHYGFTRPKLTSGGQAMADMAMEQYETYGGQDESILAPHYWSIFYGSPSSSTAAWCCCFVYSCGILLDKQIGGDKHIYVGTNDSVLGPPFGGCEGSWNFLEGKHRTHTEASYIPQPGDLIYFCPANNKSSRSHIGIVINTEPNGNVRIIDGNWNNTVSMHSFSNYAAGQVAYTSGGVQYIIVGYANPDYPDDANPDDVRVFYLASGNNDFVHMWRGNKTYGRMNAPINVVAGMVDVFRERYPEIYEGLGGDSMDIASDEFDSAWDALASSDPDGFYKAIFAAYYDVYAGDFLDYLQKNFRFSLASSGALRDLAWCALTRDGSTRGYNTFYVAMTDADHNLRAGMTPRDIINAYYTERKSNLSREFTNAEERAEYTRILDAEYNYLLQELGPNG